MRLQLSVLCLVIQLLVTNVLAEGLIEVFKWKQMDFYNRGSNPQLTAQPPATVRDPGMCVQLCLV